MEPAIHGYMKSVLYSAFCKIHKEKSNKMQECIKILLFRIYMKLNMFRPTRAHHQEPKTALSFSGFLYVKGCWTCRWWTLSGTQCLTTSILYEAQHVSGDTPPIIRSLKLHCRPLVFHTWKVVEIGRAHV